MGFRLDEALAVLSRTPASLDALLRDLPDAWTRAHEGTGTWSAYDVVGHLVHGERTDWLPRVRIVLEAGEARTFEPFDRFAQERQADRSLGDLLDEFRALRDANLVALSALELSEADLARTGTHPSFGRVALRELLSAWVVHDLGHVAQVARVMAKRYAEPIGPWREFLPVVSERTRR